LFVLRVVGNTVYRNVLQLNRQKNTKYLLFVYNNYPIKKMFFETYFIMSIQYGCLALTCFDRQQSMYQKIQITFL